MKKKKKKRFGCDFFLWQLHFSVFLLSRFSLRTVRGRGRVHAHMSGCEILPGSRISGVTAALTSSSQPAIFKPLHHVQCWVLALGFRNPQSRERSDMWIIVFYTPESALLPGSFIPTGRGQFCICCFRCPQLTDEVNARFLQSRGVSD